MNEGPDIQHKVTHVGAPGFAFEAGQRVQFVEPDPYFDEAPPASADLDLEPFLDFLMLGAKTRSDIADTVLFLAFLMPGVTRRPRNYTELGLWMGVSGTTAKARLEAKKAILAGECLSLLERRPVSDEQRKET